MIIIENDKLDEVKTAHASELDEIRVPLSVDMFTSATGIMARYGHALVVDKNGNDVTALGEFACTYVSTRDHNGLIDTEFIDRYEVLFLHDCNELSVELIRDALDKWSGKTLVLVGENWKYVIDELPDLNGIECIWQDEVLSDFYGSVTSGRKFLHVTKGLPCEEPMDRYENNIMSYDEVLGFTFLFATRKELGPNNPDKNFFIVDALYSNLGLFAIYDKAICLARYAKKKGFIPVMRIKNEVGSINLYQDGRGDEIWGKFFNQPEGFSLSDVLESKNVYFPPVIYNARIMQTLMDRFSGDIRLSWPDGVYNDKITEYLDIKEKEFLPYPDKTLGVIARGTDYVGTHLANHAIHASKEMLGDKIEELLDKWNLEFIFIATEDASYYGYFKERFKDRVYMTDQERYTTMPNEMLAQMYRKRQEHNGGYRRGADYLLAVHLLSKCNSLLASGNCMAVGKTREMKKEEYKNVFVFDLGKNKS